MNAVQIYNHDLEIKEYNGQRVVTLKDIDRVHERPDGTARKRFNDNRKHFIENVDYYRVQTSEFQAFGFASEKRTQKGNPNIATYLLSKTGYLMLVKSFTDDLAWKVQRQLVNCYQSL